MDGVRILNDRSGEMSIFPEEVSEMEGWKTEGISNSKVPRYKTGNSEVMSALFSDGLSRLGI
jgi:hypothetical protein